MVSITTGGVGRTDAKPRGEKGVHPMMRIGVVCLVLAGFALAIWIGLPEKLSLDQLRIERTVMLAFVHAHPWLSLMLYVGLYAAIVGLSIPGALVMTLTGGFLFGPLEGSAAAVTGVSLGSILMFFVAQTAVGDGVRAWLRGRSPLVEKLEHEVRHHPFTSILTLRLIPAVPIWMVNLAAGFVRVPFGPYALATLIGVVPSTFLYASVGDGLDRLFGTVEPDALMSVIRSELALPALGLLCLAALPVAVRWWTGRRVAERRAVK